MEEMTVIEQEYVSSYRVTLKKIENNNKLKVDALDLSAELCLVKDMNLSRERQRNECVVGLVILTTYVRQELGQL
jgi:hypothetical protein